MKVAAYCRVSTDLADQAHSFAAQKRFFHDYVLAHPRWELYEIYADEGVSGTRTEKRPAFNRMIQDAKAGLFERILTKEVSRFSRNILDTIFYTRELKAHGIGVLFLNDGIDTLSPDAELRLSIMGSIAQEESRKTSERVKWGQTRRMEQGVVFGRSLLGYDVKNGALFVNEAGANIVRLIFQKYVYERKSAADIAGELEQMGIFSPGASRDWSASTILKIIKNEKYCGDLKQKKTITPDYLTHQKKVNHGEEPFVYIADHHEPIVSRALWQQAQTETQRRRTGKRKPAACGTGNTYALSGKIQCICCGQFFVSRCRYRKDGSSYPVWRCAAAAKGKLPHARNTCEIGWQIRNETAMEAVRAAVLSVAPADEAMAQAITGLLQRAKEQRHAQEQRQIRAIDEKSAQIEQKKDSAVDAFLSNIITESELHNMLTFYDKLRQEQQDKMKQLLSQGSAACGTDMHFSRQMEWISAGGYKSDTFYANLVERIEVYPDRRLCLLLKEQPQAVWFRLPSRYDGVLLQERIENDLQ